MAVLHVWRWPTVKKTHVIRSEECMASGEALSLNPYHYNRRGKKVRAEGTERVCVVFGCNHTQAMEGLSFFRLREKESDNARYRKWFTACDRDDLKDGFTKNHRICQVHFDGNDRTAW